MVYVHLWFYKCTLYTLQSIAFTTLSCKDLKVCPRRVWATWVQGLCHHQFCIYGVKHDAVACGRYSTNLFCINEYHMDECLRLIQLDFLLKQNWQTLFTDCVKEWHSRFKRRVSINSVTWKIIISTISTKQGVRKSIPGREGQQTTKIHLSPPRRLERSRK